MPGIHVAHVETPTDATTRGARGGGEAGSAAAAIWTTVNDAPSPFEAMMGRQPFTPERALLGKAKRRSTKESG